MGTGYVPTLPNFQLVTTILLNSASEKPSTAPRGGPQCLRRRAWGATS